MFECRCGFRLLWRFAGRGSLSDVSEGNAEIWEETRYKKELLHIMVTLKWWFKGETGYKWHMLLLVDTTDLVI